MNINIINRLIDDHELREVPRLKKLQEYFEGKHNILSRTAAEGKPNNRLIVNYPAYITNILNGYFVGKPVTYTATEDATDLLNELTTVHKLNNEHKENMELAKEMSIKGKAFEILYIDENKNIRYTQVPAEQVIIGYDQSLQCKIEYAIRYYTSTDLETNKDTLNIELYLPDRVIYYTKNDNDLTLVKEVPHYFGECPVLHFKNNQSQIGDWENIITLLDDLESKLSDNSNELHSFRNAYLKIKNMTMDAETMAAVRNAGAFEVDGDGDVEFLTKNINDQFSKDHITTLIDFIHKVAMVPDLSDENFGNLSGIALQMKVYCMSQVAAIKELNFKEALDRRTRLITNMLNFLRIKNYDSSLITANFTMNLPIDTASIVDEVQKLTGIISTDSLLSMLPMVSDVELEKQKIKADKEDSLSDDYSSLGGQE